MTIRQYLKCYALYILLAPIPWKFFGWLGDVGDYYKILYGAALIFGLILIFYIFEEFSFEDLDRKITEVF